MESNHFAINPPLQRIQYDVNEAFEAKLRFLKVSDLQYILRKHSLHTTGNKLSLIGRICDYFKNAVTKANAGQITIESIASMFAEVESLYGSKLNSSTRSYMPAPPQTYNPPPSIPLSAPQSTNGSSSNGVYSPGISPYVTASFEENSFCQHQSVLIQVRVLNLKESHGGHVFNFDLPKEIGHALYTNNINLNNNNSDTKYCIQLFCFDMRKLEGGHCWPAPQQSASTFELRVNQRVFPIKRGGKKDKDRVADITAYCRGGNNSVTVLWNGSGSYQIYVTLSKRIPVETLVDTVITKRSRDYDMSLEAIKKTLSKRAGSDELQEVSTKVSLMCPVTKALMHTPCRATTCNHLQCFELQSYLMMNERVPRWQCPHCSKTALYKDLFTDNFFKKVIEQVSKAEITEIEFKPDASWIPVSKKRKVEQIENNKQVLEILDDDDNTTITNNNTTSNNNSYSSYRVASPPNGAFRTNLTNSSNSLSNSSSNINNITNTFPSSNPTNSYNPITSSSLPKPIYEPPEGSQYGYDITKCFVCGSTSSLKRCSRCRGICYCGVPCQTKDWNRHKEECRDVSTIQTNGFHSSAKTADSDSQFAQQKYKMQKKESLSTLADSAVQQQPASSGNAHNPIELD